MTGNNIGQMLNEIKIGQPAVNTRTQGLTQLQQVATASLLKMEIIIQDLANAWGLVVPRKTQSGLDFQTQIVTAQKAALLYPPYTTIVEFDKSYSKEWTEIGKMLLTLPELHTLSLKDCDSGDILCEFIPNYKALLRLRLGTMLFYLDNCRVTDAGVSLLVGNEQLIELALSSFRLELRR